MKLTESNFLLYAAQNYDNPFCEDITEFEEDLKRIQYIRKLFNRYIMYGDLKERLILNHMIVIYNIFGQEGTNMLFMKLEGFHEQLKPFVVFLNYMPEIIEYDDHTIKADSIISDCIIEDKLKRI